jgi:hypothetical protein
MDVLDIGIDIGFSKTNLVVARADGQLLLETRIEHFEAKRQQLITEELWFSEEQLLSEITQQLASFKKHPLSLFIGGFIESPPGFLDRLHGAGFDVQTFEAFTDVHNHYGLTDMPGNALMVACGSHWNAMYYDRANNTHWFESPQAIWDEVPHSFAGITFARFLLTWWSKAWQQGISSPIADEILARSGLSPAALYDTVKQDPLLDALFPPSWLALGPLISQYADEEPVSSFLDRGIKQLEHLYDLFRTQISPVEPPLLVLGGPIWSNVLFERAQEALTQTGIPVRHSQGNPALGAIRFWRANPTVPMDPWGFRIRR